MSETTNPQSIQQTPATKKKISIETARASVITMFEAFELPLEIEDEISHEEREDPFIKKLAEAVQRGRLEISGEGDDVQIIQHLRRESFGVKKFTWNWMRLGMGKARLRVGADGLSQFGGHYQIAAPMIGYEAGEIQNLHPVDLSLVEDIAGFFRKI